jgi:DNA/RNA endonuclease YhcR with UshA esterase domain
MNQEIKMRKLSALRLLMFPLLAGTLLFAQATQTRKLTPSEAKEHVGEKAIVCGMVVSTNYAESSGGKPTFLNLEKPYPNQIFTIVIWGSNRPKFGVPDKELSGKHICVSGTITVYDGVAEIKADEPQQIKIESPK